MQIKKKWENDKNLEIKDRANSNTQKIRNFCVNYEFCKIHLQTII